MARTRIYFTRDWPQEGQETVTPHLSIANGVVEDGYKSEYKKGDTFAVRGGTIEENKNIFHNSPWGNAFGYEDVTNKKESQ
jgi:hypothetical protein